jgi:hypothetical protein
VDLAAVFALSLLGGYFFAAWWRFTAYATRRYDGHHLYFRAAACGIIFFALALALRTFVIPHYSVLARFDAWLLDYVRPALKEEDKLPAAYLDRRMEWVATSLYSVVLGPLTALLLTLVTPKQWALRHTVGALDQLLLRAQREKMAVSITLNNGKVYVGPVVSISDPDGEPTVFKLLPMMSGNRDSLGRIVLTTDYEDVYTKLNDPVQQQKLKLPGHWIEQFHLAIRVDAVVTATLFSTAVYAEFNPDWKQQIAAQKLKAPPEELLVEIKRTPKPAVPAMPANVAAAGSAVTSPPIVKP